MVQNRAITGYVFTGALLGALLFFAGAFSVSAATTDVSNIQDSFFVDSGFDSEDRSEITATLRAEGDHAQAYIEDSYWNSLSPAARDDRLADIKSILTTFDSDTYDSVRGVFGSEWKPGIDGRNKITMLFTDMDSSLGGYFREEDEQSGAPNSNEREMFYLNTSQINNAQQINAFAAHELQHLINYNQKRREHNVEEETWLNEMLSEVSVSIAGHNTPYSGSNLNSRVQTFLSSPSDALTRWRGLGTDYAAVNLFGHFFRDHYSDDALNAIIQTENTGISAVENALNSVGSGKSFDSVFRDWVVANLVNNCNVLPENQFCYLNPSLGFENFHITFGSGTEEGDSVTNSSTVHPWEGAWFSYKRSLNEEKPEDHIFNIEFEKNTNSTFSVSYVVYEENKEPQVYYANVEGNRAVFAVENFGYTVDQIVVMPINEGDDRNILSSFTINAELSTTTADDITSSQSAASASTDLPNGALVRAEGSDEIYIIKNTSGENAPGYRRWVQSEEIMNMYGHLSFSDVITVSREQLNEYKEVNVIKTPDSDRVWWVSKDGEKRWLQTVEEFKSLGYTFDMIYIVKQIELDWYPII